MTAMSPREGRRRWCEHGRDSVVVMLDSFAFGDRSVAMLFSGMLPACLQIVLPGRLGVDRKE